MTAAAGPDRRTLGIEGERLAADFLKKRGCRILRRNCRAGMGEVDLVAQDGEDVVFVEVRTLTGQDAPEPEMSVTAEKRLRLSRAAITLAHRYALSERPLRFDVVAVHIRSGREPEIRHYPDAFPLILTGG